MKIKNEILFGRLLGIVFESNGRRKIWNNFLSLPYLIVYVFVLWYNLKIIFLDQSRSRFWKFIIERCFVLILICSQFVFPLYYFLRRFALKKLLIKIDKNATIVDLEITITKSNLPKIVRGVGVILIFIKICVLWQTSLLAYHFCYGLPLYWLFFHQSWVYKVAQDVAIEFEIINKFMSTTLVGNDQTQWEKLTKCWNKFENLLQICGDLNNIIGFSILLCTFISFLLLIASSHYLQYVLREEHVVKILHCGENFLRIVFALLILYHTIDAWEIINKQVRCFCLN